MNNQTVYNLEKNESKVIFDFVTSKKAHSDILVNLNGEGARVDLIGIFVGGSDDVFDIKHTVVHNAPRTTSEILVKGVLDKNAQADYGSLIKMNEGVRQAEGNQQEDTLVISPKAKIYSVPNLEIAHNDVKCSHGVSTTNVDKNKLFFMNSRGIKTKEAIQALVLGHLSSVLDQLEEEEKQDALQQVQEILEIV